MAHIDMSYYNEDCDYDYSEEIYCNVKSDILDYIKTIKRDEYYNILEKDKRTNIYNIFWEARNNIIKPFNFNKDDKVLEVCANYGEMTGELLKKFSKVTVIETSKIKAEAIKTRYDDCDNLEIICADLKNIIFNENYDVIVLAGVLELYKKLNFNSQEELLLFFKKILSYKGRIILATDNKFGAKFLAGAKKYSNDYYNSNITGINDIKLLGKNELINLIRKVGFKKYRFLYPLPDYKLTNVIYSDNWLPNTTEHKFNYNIYYNDFDEIIGIESDILNEANKNNVFDIFVNSYIIEIGNNTKFMSDLEFVSFNNLRVAKYKTFIKKEKNQFIKESYNSSYTEHIKNIKEIQDKLKFTKFNCIEKISDNNVISNCIKDSKYDEYIGNSNNENEVLEKIDYIFKFLDDNLIFENSEENFFKKYNVYIEKEKMNKLHFVKYGFWDLIFQNIFIHKSQGMRKLLKKEDYLIVFDQEWCEKYMPIEFIKYRAIKQLYESNSSLNQIISYEKILKKYELYDYINEFNELDEKLIDKITDKNILEFYEKSISKITSIEKIEEDYKKELSVIYNKYDQLVEKLEK